MFILSSKIGYLSSATVRTISSKRGEQSFPGSSNRPRRDLAHWIDRQSTATASSTLAARVPHVLSVAWPSRSGSGLVAQGSSKMHAGPVNPECLVQLHHSEPAESIERGAVQIGRPRPQAWGAGRERRATKRPHYAGCVAAAEPLCL